MKSLLTFLFASLLFTSMHAQKGLTIGANVMPLNSNIIEQNTWGLGREYDYVPTYNTSWGIDIGYNINDHIGISTGYWFTDLGQQYDDNYNGSDWERNLTLHYQIYPLMVKFNSSKSKVNFLGGAGILIANLTEADQEWLRDGNTYVDNITNPITGESFNPGEEDVTDRFSDSDIMINLELGARIPFSTKLYLDTSFNFGYGFSDINAEDWRIPNASGDYDPSHNALVGLKIGLTYVLLGDSE